MFKFNEDEENLKCSFCGKDQDQMKKLVAGSGAYICNECIKLCSEIVEEGLTQSTSGAITELPTPKEIMDHLNEYTIGRERAKRSLAVAVYNHCKHIQQLESKKGNVELQKSNVASIGLTGNGKTSLAQTLTGTLNVSPVIAGATSLAKAGYTNDDVEDILLRLIQAADLDTGKAEKNIVYVDEIDKIACKSENASITHNVLDEGVRQALFKILEGMTASVPPQGGRRHPNREMIQIDITSILLIPGGAFDGIEKVIRCRPDKKVVGFSSNKADKYDEQTLLAQIRPGDLQAYGLISGFIGRVSTVVNLETLDVAILENILTQPRNALVKQYTKMSELNDVDLEFTERTLPAISKKAIGGKMDTRGLHSIIKESLTDIMFDVPSNENIAKAVIITQTINEETEPELYDAEGNLINNNRTSA